MLQPRLKMAQTQQYRASGFNVRRYLFHRHCWCYSIHSSSSTTTTTTHTQPPWKAIKLPNALVIRRTHLVGGHSTQHKLGIKGSRPVGIEWSIPLPYCHPIESSPPPSLTHPRTHARMDARTHYSIDPPATPSLTNTHTHTCTHPHTSDRRRRPCQSKDGAMAPSTSLRLYPPMTLHSLTLSLTAESR